jgi:putative NADH-flavin reductase
MKEPTLTSILFLGAAGRTGSRVLDYALSLGHIVVALARDPARVAPRMANIVAGSTPSAPESC